MTKRSHPLHTRDLLTLLPTQPVPMKPVGSGLGVVKWTVNVIMDDQQWSWTRFRLNLDDFGNVSPLVFLVRIYVCCSPFLVPAPHKLLINWVITWLFLWRQGDCQKFLSLQRREYLQSCSCTHIFILWVSESNEPFNSTAISGEFSLRNANYNLWALMLALTSCYFFK